MGILQDYGTWGRPVEAIDLWWKRVEADAVALQANGRLTESEALVEAQTQTDFGTFLFGYIATSFYKAYESRESQWRKYAAVKELPDFNEHRIKGKNRLRGIGYVGEHGHYPGGRRTFRPEASIILDTYGVLQEITRQALLTQGIRELVADEPQELGEAFAEFLSRALIALMVSNPIAPDGVAMAHASRGNLVTVPLGEASFIDAATWFDEQEDDDGVPITNSARHLIVKSTRLAVVANRIIRSQTTGVRTAAETPSATPDKGTRNAIPDSVSIPADFVVKESYWPVATDWTMVSDPARVAAFMVGLLQGQTEPFIGQEMGTVRGIRGGGIDRYQLNVDKVATKGRWDLGTAAVDPRGWYAGRPA